MIRRHLKIWALLALAAPCALAVDLNLAQQDAGQAGAFLAFGASARSLGMGEAHTAIADDASAAYWNPAGLAQLERRDITTLYSVLPENTSFGFFSYAQPSVDYGTFGMSLVSLRSANFEKRTAIGENVGSFDEADTALFLSHGIHWKDRFAFGSNVKVIRQEIDTFKATGYGLDLGGMWTMTPRAQLGLSLKNVLAPKMKLKTVSESYPRDVRLGIKIVPAKRWLLDVDLDRTENRSLKPYLGTEWRANNVVVLRAGLNETELTAGVGLQFGDWSIDYAFGYHQAESELANVSGAHRFGFNFKFGSSVNEEGQSVRWQRKGQLALQMLRDKVDGSTRTANMDVASLIDLAEQAMKHQGLPKPKDLYSVQGYVSYFRAEFERSVQSLTEALSQDPTDPVLQSHLDKARALLTEAQKQNMIAQEMKKLKEAYARGDYQTALACCKKVLSIQSDHVEAAAYLEDVQARINEPINRELKIARTKMSRDEQLDAIKHLQAVKKLDPNNADADQLMAAAIKALEDKATQAQSLAVPELQVVAEHEDRKVYEVEKDPKKSRSLYSQGLMFYSQGKLKDAVTVWEQAVKVDGENQLAINAYNRALAEIQETAQ